MLVHMFPFPAAIVAAFLLFDGENNYCIGVCHLTFFLMKVKKA